MALKWSEVGKLPSFTLICKLKADVKTATLKLYYIEVMIELKGWGVVACNN